MHEQVGSNSLIFHDLEGTLRKVSGLGFHPWEFWPMPQGPIHYGEGTVIPDPFIVKNCGDYALEQLDLLITRLKDMGAEFLTCRALAEEYS